MTTISAARPTSAPAGLPDTGALEADARALSRALSDFVRVVQFRDRDRACCYDVSVSQCYALKAVADADGLTVNELAAELYLEKSSASRLANGLVEAGYLKRGRDPEDGRVVRLETTPRGADLHARIEGDLVREYADLLADLPPDVRSGVVDVVGRLGGTFASRVDTSGGSCCTRP